MLAVQEKMHYEVYTRLKSRESYCLLINKQSILQLIRKLRLYKFPFNGHGLNIICNIKCDLLTLQCGKP